MKFLIDECLSTDLASIAHATGYSAEHVARTGLASTKDWDLVPYLIENDLVMVTRNSKDFRGRSGKPGYLTSQSLHPGLICLNATNMDGSLMEALFKAALDYLEVNGIQDLMNQVLELDFDEKNEVLNFNLYEAPDGLTANATV